MEDSENKQSINFQKELKNISTLQQRINQAKKELNHLFKIENHETKNIQDIYKQSLLTTRNKLNFFQNHQILQHHHQNVSQEIKHKHDRVKELKTKEEKQLKEAKQMMKKSKEEERNLIRNNSLRYNLTIKKNKEIEQELKQKLVKEMKKEKENYKQSLMESRAKEIKLKQVKLLNQTLAKIQREPFLLKELDRLTKEKQQVEHKLKDKKVIKFHLKEGVQKIKRLEKTQIAQLLTQGEQQEDMKKSKVSELNPLKVDLSQQKKILKSVQSIENILPLIPQAKIDLDLH